MTFALNAADQAVAARDLAKAENDLANQAINEIWKNFDEEIRAQLLPLQRAWIKKKIADCNIEAAQFSTDPVAREAERLRCDTQATKARANELREYY